MRTFKWWMVPIAVIFSPIIVIGSLCLFPFYLLIALCVALFCDMFDIKTPAVFETWEMG